MFDTAILLRCFTLVSSTGSHFRKESRVMKKKASAAESLQAPLFLSLAYQRTEPERHSVLLSIDTDPSVKSLITGQKPYGAVTFDQRRVQPAKRVVVHK